MKKSTVRIIVVAIVMIAIGLGLFVGGIAAVGGFDAAKGILNDHGVHIELGFGIDIDHSKGTTASEKIHSDGSAIKFGTEDVTGFELEIGAAKVEIVQNHSGDEISIRTEGDFDIYVKNSILHVEIRNELEEHSIVLEIPKNAVFESIEIQGNACEMYVQYLEAKTIDVQVEAGMVAIDELTAGNAEFEIGVGEMVIEGANVQNCTADVDLGNFEYHGEISKYGDIECGMGNAELHLEGDEEDYNYEIDCAAGNVSIGNQRYSGVGTKKVISHQADSTIEVECGLGNVTVDF